MKEKEINAGYEIIERFPVGEQGFAIGHSETAPAPYVTWQYRTADPAHFFWGHYLNSKEAAYEDYRGRINAEIEYIAERTHKPPLLPLFCYSLMPSSGELIRIERGCKGYEQVPYGSTGDPASNRGNTIKTTLAIIDIVITIVLFITTTSLMIFIIKHNSVHYIYLVAKIIAIGSHNKRKIGCSCLDLCKTCTSQQN